MAKLNLSQAAKAVGKNRVTIWRHINSGKLSAEKDRDGNPLVDTSELLRVYGELKSNATRSNTKKQHDETPSYEELLLLVKEMRREQSEMKEMISTLQNRLEHKQPIPSHNEGISRAEQDPSWPKNIETMQDIVIRKELREKYGESN